MKFGDELIELSGREIKIARVISRLTPAPLINLYVGIVISIYPATSLGPILNPVTNLLICIGLMVILPISPIIYEARKGNVDLDISSREMRTRFFMFALGCYAIAYTVYWWTLCSEMTVLAAAYFTVTLGVMLANRISKVSVHGAGVSGPGTALIYIYGGYALPVVLLWLAIIWARPKLKQHTTLQTLAGVALGIVITLLTYLILYI